MLLIVHTIHFQQTKITSFPKQQKVEDSKVETLPGGTNLGEIDDLKYFTNKLIRGLRIPSSYLPTAAQDEGQKPNLMMVE